METPFKRKKKTLEMSSYSFNSLLNFNNRMHESISDEAIDKIPQYAIREILANYLILETEKVSTLLSSSKALCSDANLTKACTTGLLKFNVLPSSFSWFTIKELSPMNRAAFIVEEKSNNFICRNFLATGCWQGPCKKYQYTAYS